MRLANRKPTPSRASAERRVAVAIAQAPRILATIAASLDLESLEDATRELVEIVQEFPILCAEVGPAAVAAKLNRPENVVAHLRWWELTPAGELNGLPSLEEAVKLLSPAPPLERIGALARWREEVRLGVGGQRPETPATWRHDGLYLAACHERAALEAEAEGNGILARELMEKAAWALAGEAAAHRRSA